MNATILDLRYKMKKVLGALDNRESVQVLYHGKIKGVIIPAGGKAMKTSSHAFFGSEKSGDTIADVMSRLRGGRYRDI
jgi:hypothetical protein